MRLGVGAVGQGARDDAQGLVNEFVEAVLMAFAQGLAALGEGGDEVAVVVAPGVDELAGDTDAAGDFDVGHAGDGELDGLFFFEN